MGVNGKKLNSFKCYVGDNECHFVTEIYSNLSVFIWGLRQFRWRKLNYEKNRHPVRGHPARDAACGILHNMACRN